MRLKKQTLEERDAIKRELRTSGVLPRDTYAKVLIMDDCTIVTESELGKQFSCCEIQLKGCLIESGIRRRYVSYADFENYEVTN